MWEMGEGKESSQLQIMCCPAALIQLVIIHSYSLHTLSKVNFWIRQLRN